MLGKFPSQASSEFRSGNRTNRPKGCLSNDLYQTKPPKVNQFVPVSEQRAENFPLSALYVQQTPIAKPNLGT